MHKIKTVVCLISFIFNCAIIQARDFSTSESQPSARPVAPSSQISNNKFILEIRINNSIINPYYSNTLILPLRSTLALTLHNDTAAGYIWVVKNKEQLTKYFAAISPVSSAIPASSKYLFTVQDKMSVGEHFIVLEQYALGSSQAVQQIKLKFQIKM
jgi:hypothetical protein